MSHNQYIDALVKEYMVFRGFSSSLKSLDAELRNEKGLRADKIVEQITSLINSHDLQGLRDLWSHLDNSLFSKLDHSLSAAVKKLEHGVLKLYLVTAHVSGKPDKISELFSKLSSELYSQPEWREWFYFSFCKNPEETSAFAMYFTKQWQDTLLISLHNFLATIYQCVPQPALSKLEYEFILLKKLQEENSVLKAHICDISNSQSSGTNNNTNFSDIYRRGKSSRSYLSVQSLNDITALDVSPPGHIVDDFYIIATENVNLSQMTDFQSRGLKYLIKNISSAGSPVLGRKEASERNKRRSESVGRSWV